MKKLEIVTVVVADDSSLIRDTVRRHIDRAGGFTVVGCAADGDEAMRLVRKLNPALLVLDLNMPNTNGMEVLRRLRRRKQAPKTVVMSLHDDPPFRKAALRAGADAFCTKLALASELTPTLRTLFPESAPECP